jgi:hypothetical protein
MAEEERPMTATARVHTDLLEMARIVCAHTKDGQGRHLKLTEYLDSVLRERITRDHAAVLKRIARQHRDD